MATIDTLIEKMQREPANIRFGELEKVCMHFFGKPRQNGTSHQIYKMPWPGDPRINIQRDGNKAKAYQVKQVLLAIQKWQEIKR